MKGYAHGEKVAQGQKVAQESLAASDKALAHENAQYVFRLGQKVRHKLF
ncbi:hypothetical protein A2U01_0030776, partial [Trifolium medium]|nr:hypothetical protein [Trifolium medium]